jgi:hypothetical protein
VQVSECLQTAGVFSWVRQWKGKEGRWSVIESACPQTCMHMQGHQLVLLVSRESLCSGNDSFQRQMQACLLCPIALRPLSLFHYSRWIRPLLLHSFPHHRLAGLDMLPPVFFSSSSQLPFHPLFLPLLLPSLLEMPAGAGCCYLLPPVDGGVCTAMGLHTLLRIKPN